ncbi:MAG: 50S ribosomal protein L21 [Candidatus Binatia bacterium]
MSFAVIRTGGKQYRVSSGSVLTVEKLEGDVGDGVAFDEVLLSSDGSQVRVGTPLVEGASVNGVIVRQDRDPHILVFKKKKRKNYRRRQGHRQWVTTVSITEIT